MDIDGQADPEAAPASWQRSVEEAKAHVGFAVQLVIRALRGGEGPILASALIRLLPSLIRIQAGLQSGPLMIDLPQQVDAGAKLKQRIHWPHLLQKWTCWLQSGHAIFHALCTASKKSR